MPTFLNMITATIYGQGSPDLTFDSLNQGWQLPALYRGPSYRAFARGSGISFIALSPAVTVTNQGVSVTLNSIIEIAPTGLQVKPTKYVTDSTFTNLYNQGA